MSEPRERLPLDRDALCRALGPAWDVELHAEAGSTNALAAAAARAGLVVVADHQVAGRGRLDRTWDVPARAALTFSAVLDPRLPDARWPLLPLAAGAAVADAVDGAVKWPNDVLIEGRKVCGVLVERVQPAGRAPLAVVGIGVNVHQTREELPVPTATSLALAGRATDRVALLVAVLGGVRGRIDALAADPAGFLATYRERCDTLGRVVRVDLPDGTALRGTAEDVDPHGRLVVRPDTGGPAVAVSAGDVVHVRAVGAAGSGAESPAQAPPVG